MIFVRANCKFAIFFLWFASSSLPSSLLTEFRASQAFQQKPPDTNFRRRNGASSSAPTTTTTTTAAGMSVSSGLATVAKRSLGRLKPESTLFLLCDIQERFRPLIWRGETIVRTARYMTSVAGALDIPVVITQQYTKVFGETVPDCFADPEHKASCPVFDKKKFSMCTDGFEAHVKELNKPSVVLFGIEAHVCVQQTCLDLLEAGAEVHLVADGISSQQAFDREIAFRRMADAGAYVTTAQSVAFELMRTSAHPNFRAVSKLTVDHTKLPNEFSDAIVGADEKRKQAER